MATDAIALQRTALDAPTKPTAARSVLELIGAIAAFVLRPLASLKLTVALMALAIFLVLAGTLAQRFMDIWEVMNLYFRCFVAWIDLKVFLPRIWIPSGWYTTPVAVPFPGGFAIGGAMLVNLFAAHALRFKVQARGGRLAAGLATTAVGVALTWLVIASASGVEGLRTEPIVSYASLWMGTKLALVGVWLAAGYALARTDSGQSLHRAILGVVVVGLAALLGWLFFRAGNNVLGESSMRILWQLVQGLFTSLILLAGCVLLFKKRAGIVLLHAGVALLMINEMVVYSAHVETLMLIPEGTTVNHARDTRAIELAVIDHSDPDDDIVVVIPNRFLKEENVGQTISDDQLPFDVELVKFFKNSTIRKLNSKDENLATAGAGLESVAEEARATAGADSDGALDLAAAYVKLTGKDATKKDLGTYLVTVSPMPTEYEEPIMVGDRPYNLSLRFKHVYKPNSVTLKDVRADKYMGTSTVRNYSSDVRIVDPKQHVDREVRIWMNNPLRYGGDTYYQSGYYNFERFGEVTGLQVVSNVGWMIPYVACMIVGTGMLAQFSIVLLRFLNRQTAEQSAASKTRPPGGPKSIAARADAEPTAGLLAWCGRLLPWIVVAGCAAWVIKDALPPRASSEKMNLYEFGQFPVMYQGRVKPFDTLARNSLRIISDRETFTGGDGKQHSAIEWFLDTITSPDKSREYNVVRIQNLDVLETFGLSRREGYRYSIEELSDKFDEFRKQVGEARKLDVAELTLPQKKLVELDNRLQTIEMLLTAFDHPPIRADREHLQGDLARLRAIAEMQLPLAVPPEKAGDSWQPYSLAWARAWIANLMRGQPHDGQPEMKPNPATLALEKVFAAYAERDVAEFNTAVDEYRAELSKNPPEEWNPARTNFEALFNKAAPFYHASVLYGLAFVLAALGWIGWRVPLNRSAFWLIALTFALHTAALIARIYISQRPPVTNLYSAAVFVGWGVVAFGLVLEAIFKLGFGNIIAGVAGFATLLIAHFLAAGGDTFVVLQAVLDTQFWLATHVVIITLGYATTFLAGLLGLLYVLMGVLTTSLTDSLGRVLARVIYGSVCFSIIFSFIGTVLGGLWADDSWGRFWGWDPKENGALIIVLWNALVLHARWDGLVKDRGLAVLAIIGNIAVSWSMFGVNELGVGLHSYGFTEGIARALLIFVGTQLAVVALGCLPRHVWGSSRGAQPA